LRAADASRAQAYPPGKHFTVPPLPNVTVVNQLGDFDIAADRLAIIDGEGLSINYFGFPYPAHASPIRAVDPWRPATPHSDYAYDREDTVLRPFKVIPGTSSHSSSHSMSISLQYKFLQVVCTTTTSGGSSISLMSRWRSALYIGR
jgi:hypothetical protein